MKRIHNHLMLTMYPIVARDAIFVYNCIRFNNLTAVACDLRRLDILFYLFLPFLFRAFLRSIAKAYFYRVT